MKLQFKVQKYQTEAVDAVVDVFTGQPYADGVKYRIDPGKCLHPDVTAAPPSRSASSNQRAGTGDLFLIVWPTHVLAEADLQASTRRA